MSSIHDCSSVRFWPAFVKWLRDKTGEDLRFGLDGPPKNPEVTFRGQRFDYCPFCGRAFGFQGPHGSRPDMATWHARPLTEPES